MKELLFALLAKAYNLAPERIAELLFKTTDDGTSTEELADNALAQILELDQNRVKSLKSEDGKGAFDNGHKKGLKEASEKLEREIRDAFSIESTSTGLDLVKEIVSNASKATLTDDQVKLHPLFLNKEKEARTGVDQIKAEMEQKIKELQDGYGRKDRFSSASQRIADIFDSLKPVLPSNPIAASTQRQAFLDIFAKYDFDILQDGTIVVKDETGKRVENTHGHPLNLADMIKTEAESRFDLAVQAAKGNAGNGAAQAGAGNAVDFVKPKSADEARTRLYQAKTPEERAPLFEAIKEFEPQPSS